MVVLYIRIYQVAAQKSKARRKKTHNTLRHLALGGVALHATSVHVQPGGTTSATPDRGRKKSSFNNGGINSTELSVIGEVEEPITRKKDSISSATGALNTTQKRSEMSFSERISCSASGVVISLKKNPARSLISLKKEQKAAKTLGIILGSFIACWLPFFILYLSGPLLDYFSLSAPVWVFKLFTWLGYLNSCCNPIIYTIFNKEFRQAFQKICKKVCCTIRR